MDYRKEAIDCVKDHVLPLHKQIYAKFDGDFDRIYSEGYNSKSYQGRVIEPGKVYELSYLECSCPKVKCGLRKYIKTDQPSDSGEKPIGNSSFNVNTL